MQIPLPASPLFARLSAGIFPLAWVAGWVAVAVPLSAQDFEAPPSLHASEVLEPVWLKSSLHEVSPVVGCDHGLIVFTLQSPAGLEEIAGIELLKRRVREIHATAALAEKSTAGAAVKGIVDEGEGTAKTLVGAVKQPVKTLFDIPKGLAAIAKRSVGSVENKMKAGGQYTGGPVQDWFKVSQPKLTLAAGLGVDPYSDYEPLQKQLDRLATTAAVSGIGLRLLVPGDGIIAAANAGDLASQFNDVYRTLPSQLFQENVKLLGDLGISKDRASQFLSSMVYSPADQSTIVRALAVIKPAEGVDAFLDAAETVANQGQGFLFRRSTELLRKHHESGASLTAVCRFGDNPAAIGKDGRLVIPVYVDRVYWTPQACATSQAVKAAEKQGGFTGTDLVLASEVSRRACRELKELGYRLIWSKIP